jgi:hypothetical protein
VVDFLICEIEDTVLDGLFARRQLPYAHYLCHIFAQLIWPPQSHATLEAPLLQFGFYRPPPEDIVPALASTSDIKVEDKAIRHFEDQGIVADTSFDDDDPMKRRISGFRHHLLCHLVPMITRLIAPVLLQLPLQQLTLLWLLFFSRLLSSRLIWPQSRLGRPLSSSSCPSGCS